MSQENAELVGQVIRARRTEKVLCSLEDHRPVPSAVEAERRPEVRAAIEAAGWAPFHYARETNGIAEPWRAHVLWHDRAIQTAHHLRDELGVMSKEPLLLAGCSAAVIVTWLPQFYDDGEKPVSPAVREERRVRDEEHLAAASCMVQNLLLMLTASGMGTYWSSGGRLRKPDMFDYLGIDSNERFLAGVFIEYPEMMDGPKQRKLGSHREKRGTDWIRVVE
ncbi:MAG: nitroreductase family protein [Phycisphaeraceae bacterium]